MPNKPNFFRLRSDLNKLKSVANERDRSARRLQHSAPTPQPVVYPTIGSCDPRRRRQLDQSHELVTEDSSATTPLSQADEEELAGPVIAELIMREVEAARTGAVSIQSRGQAVISSSGTLVILLFGLSTLATKAQNFTLPTYTKLPLYSAAAFLLLAAFAAIITNAPRKREAIPSNKLRPLLNEKYWGMPTLYAQREVAKSQLAVLEGERRTNVQMARWLQLAITLELIGITSVMCAAVMLIFGA